MGVKFNREYEDISNELTEAIYKIEDFYTFFEMNSMDFNALDEEERKDCAKTLADDLFYGLDVENIITVGIGNIEYNKEEYIIIVRNGKGGEQIIHLI